MVIKWWTNSTMAALLRGHFRQTIFNWIPKGELVRWYSMEIWNNAQEPEAKSTTF